MSDSSSLPKAISHKQLDALLHRAKKNSPSSSHATDEVTEENEAFEQLLLNWTSLSKDLLNTLNKKSSTLIATRDQKSLMALGALSVHLSMALKAKEDSDSNS